MTKREFFENELNMTPSEVGSAVPMDNNPEVTTRWLIALIKHLIEDRKEARKTLRDQFAMSALMCINPDFFDAPEFVAEKAYWVADAMMEFKAQREKNNG